MNFSVILERALPLSQDILERLTSGELKLHGGTIRDNAGRIVKHLIFPQDGQIHEDSNLVNQLKETISQSHTDVISQLANQTAILSAVNIITAHKATETLGRKLDEISDKIDKLAGKISRIHDEVIYSKFIKFSELKSSSLNSIEEALYINKVSANPESIRLHIAPLRETFNSLHTMLMDMINELSNRKIIESISFIMLIADLKNKSSFVLGQTHIRLNEDDMAQLYFEKNNESNEALRSKLESLKKTGAFSPHIISENQVASLKSDIANFKLLECQSQMLSIQNKLSLELQIPHYELLNNKIKTILTLEPIHIENGGNSAP
ncbi:hypothetical protein ACWXV2_21265 [Pantoea ananatis]